MNTKNDLINGKSTKNIIVADVEYGSFRLPINFGIKQRISDAVFDSGCDHSLISANSLIFKDDTYNAELSLLYNINIPLSFGRGVESDVDSLHDVMNTVIKINNIKKGLKAKDISKDDATNILKDKIDIIIKSKNVRYKVGARNYTIGEMQVGDIAILVSFGTKNMNLIGMQIIRTLYSILLGINDRVFLITSKSDTLVKKEVEFIKNNIVDFLDISDTKAIEANYIIKRIGRED